MTVRLRLLVVLAAMSIMAIVAMTVPFVATSTLLDELKHSTSFSLQASAAYARLAQSLGEQETAVSGYLLTENENYLDQYYNGAAGVRVDRRVHRFRSRDRPGVRPGSPGDDRMACRLRRPHD